eukprot:CAMPEP_0202865672 /NCGR_PEP_ID=MMETSP1391-20130828/6289_1 /ASSEMBLY_ACC=CAM_ASM_000867 /TAXON_ID=1034604 /ORGANISM="Chlamydomonas leiostraca, Strain SAG 11-49" /LENGTH=322 /DNA_ID=CAMNT_0049545537 /DNA_START=122 /DNA_END=1090 /DNA_ORIENTATION=-
MNSNQLAPQSRFQKTSVCLVQRRVFSSRQGVPRINRQALESARSCPTTYVSTLGFSCRGLVACHAAAESTEQVAASSKESKVSVVDGEVVEAVVTEVTPKTLELVLPGKKNAPAFLHISHVSGVEGVNAFPSAFAPGSTIKAMVCKAERARGRIHVSLKIMEKIVPGLNSGDFAKDPAAAMALVPAPGTLLDRPKNANNANLIGLKPHQLVEGVVVGYRPQGVVVEIDVDGQKGTALLVKANITHGKFQGFENVLPKGESVRAVVTKVGDTGKVSLGTKQLESEPGEMLVNRQQVFQQAEQRAEAWRAKMAAEAAGATSQQA